MMLILMACRRRGRGAVLRAGLDRLERRRRCWDACHGLTVGIVGMGRIAAAVRGAALRLRDAGVFHNRSPKAVDLPRGRSVAAELMRVGCRGAVPAGRRRGGLVGVDAIAAMKPTAFLVNVARGDVVDEEALIAALEGGRMKGAGLDVYAREPDVPERLRALENVVLLPHLGTATLSVREAMGRMALDNLVAFAAGRGVPNPV
jgi:lactate dehydrogenase-like 2-hydroxyacid dehydrogenase